MFQEAREPQPGRMVTAVMAVSVAPAGAAVTVETGSSEHPGRRPPHRAAVVATGVTPATAGQAVGAARRARLGAVAFRKAGMHQRDGVHRQARSAPVVPAVPAEMRASPAMVERVPPAMPSAAAAGPAAPAVIRAGRARAGSEARQVPAELAP